MEVMLETPSRVWRRIEAIEARDMPSLPSLPPFEDSDDAVHSQLDDSENDVILANGLLDIPSPMHSTPAATTLHSTARFSSSIPSRSSKSSTALSSSRGTSTRNSHHESFDVSIIPSLPNISVEPGTAHYLEEAEPEGGSSKNGAPDVYLPLEHDYDNGNNAEDLSFTDALRSVGRSRSPHPTESFDNDGTPKKNYDFSASLKSEPEPSPFDKYRYVAVRRNPAARIRTPSLSRTGSSQASSPSHSTPQSNRSLALPPSNPQSPVNAYSEPLPSSSAASPIILPSQVRHDHSNDDLGSHETSVRSMDITDVHITAPQLTDETYSEPEEGERQDEQAQNVANQKDQLESSDGEREPTFSSDGGPTPYAQNYRSPPQLRSHSPGPPESAFSSPAPSIAVTPTPAFPRRARFAISTSDERPNSSERSQEDHNDEEHYSPEDLLTPHTRRKSFLLSVINSTTRPRLKFPTPHPRSNLHLASPSTAESTPGPRVSLQIAFAGVTPRPRPGTGRYPRASHPLARNVLHSESPEASDSEAVSPPSHPGSTGAESSLHPPRPTRLSLGVTPSEAQSPAYDSAGGASFISTASSHDLTTHHRVNTSFDPSMGFGAGAGQGVGRFNAGKLNNYLHGLNRRLQEENEILLKKLRRVEEERRSQSNSASSALSAGRRVSAGGMTVGGGGMVLGNVEEDVGGEGWMEEKLELENLVDGLREDVARCAREKEEVEKALEEEKEERDNDKERWRVRMGEVERGVELIIKELEEKVDLAEERAKEVEDESAKHLKEMESQITDAGAERDEALERADKAERALESGEELGGELRAANERIGKVMGDLRNANAQIKELEAEVMRSDSRIDDLEKDLREDRDIIASLEEELNLNVEELAAERTRVQQAEQQAQQVDNELQATKAYVAELEEGAGSAVEQTEALEDELTDLKEKIRMMTAADEESCERMERLDADAQKAQKLARQMEEALEEAEKKMLADEEVVDELRSRLASMERERHQGASTHQESSHDLFAGDAEADLEALENELDAANKEIARLNALLSQSPARKAMEKARDTKVEMLEREKEELLERNKALRMAMNEINTPSKVINTSGISPTHRQVLSMSIRAPKTPGGPLRDMSWLNTPSADPTVSPLIAEIRRLNKELDIANESIDDKLDKLEGAGQGVVSLTKELEDARSKVSVLEDEIARLSRHETRRQRLLERVRCQKCHAKINISNLSRLDESSMEISKDDLETEPPTPPTRTSEALRTNLRSVNAHLETLKKDWEQQRQALLGEKAVLQDATNRLNVQVQTAKEEIKRTAENERVGERVVAGVQGELDRAKRAIADLEGNLKSERAQLRALTSKQNSIQREKNDVLTQLQRTESDMDDVKFQLQKYKKENQNLEKELRENANVEQKARLLENRVAENAETISHLRQERSLLVADHKQLQSQFLEISEQANQLRKEYDASSKTHDNRRQQLDLHLLEIADLRRALSDRADELQNVEMEKDRIIAEKNDAAETVAALEADLKRIKKDAEAFGRDLKLLRVEKEKEEVRHKEEVSRLERTRKQAQTQVRLLTEQLESQQEKIVQAREELKSHICAADEHQLYVIKDQHHKESKGLIVQIRYLKAKCMRESLWRSNLIYQKQYLLVVLSQFEKSEQTIFASIAQIGFPISLPPPTKKTRKLKSVALVVVFISRATRASNLWREQSSPKQAVVAALQDVRRRRVTTST